MHSKDNLTADIWAIKIGGSLYDSKHLIPWMNALSACSTKKIIIAGGGPFADQVRRADEKFQLNQEHSHNMAVMAMQQFSQLLSSLFPAMLLANSVSKIHQSWNKVDEVIWEPYEMVRDQCNLDKSWDITSDSLAVWLASILGINNILLVKSAKQILKETDLVALADNKCIDPGLLELSRKFKINIHILHKTKSCDFQNLLKAV